MSVFSIMCSNNINNNSNISFKAKAKVSILLNPQTALSRVNNISKAPYQTILPFAPVTKFLSVLTPIALASKSCKQYTDTFIGMAEQYIERVFTDKNVQCKPVIAKHGVCDNVEDFYKLKDEVIKAHKVTNGIVLKRDIHNAFHNIYGRGENTSEQFDEFLRQHYNITLNQIQKNSKSNLYIPRAS